MGIPKLDDKYQVVTDASGNIVYDETKDRIPNRYLYGTLKVDMDKYLKTKGKRKLNNFVNKWTKELKLIVLYIIILRLSILLIMKLNLKAKSKR